MQWQRISVFHGLILLVAGVTGPGCTQDSKVPYKPIDAETIAAYEKLGAEYGGWEKQGFPYFLSTKQQKEAKKHEPGMPGFHFKEFPKAKLPEVAVPFGLDFMYTPVTDADLKELAHLKNLTTLILINAKISDAGLKELAPLSNLSRLDLAGTKVTDAGIKDLAPLNNLSTLYLVHTNVTDVGVAELQKALPRCDIKNRLPPLDEKSSADRKI